MPLSTRTTPANGDERAQVIPLLETLHVRTGQQGRPRKRLKVLTADKGDDAKDLRRKYRRLAVRWERLAAYFNAVLAITMMHIWVHRLIVG